MVEDAGDEAISLPEVAIDGGAAIQSRSRRTVAVSAEVAAGAGARPEV